MFQVYASAVQGQQVILALYGTEGEPEPCLLWRDQNPDALVLYCKVQSATGSVVTAKSEHELRSAALELGLLIDESQRYLP